MRYGIIGSRSSKVKNHIGLIHSDGRCVKLNIFNKYQSSMLLGRNKKLFQELLVLLNKYYDLEDLNKKNKSNLTQKKYKRIKKGTLK